MNRGAFHRNCANSQSKSRPRLSDLCAAKCGTSGNHTLTAVSFAVPRARGPAPPPFFTGNDIGMGAGTGAHVHQNAIRIALLQPEIVSEWDPAGCQHGHRNHRPGSMDVRDAFRRHFAEFASRAAIRLVLMAVQRRWRVAGSTPAVPGTPPLGRKAA